MRMRIGHVIKKGFSGQRYMCRQLKNKWSKKVEAVKGRGSERYETKNKKLVSRVGVGRR